MLWSPKHVHNSALSRSEFFTLCTLCLIGPETACIHHWWRQTPAPLALSSRKAATCRRISRKQEHAGCMLLLYYFKVPRLSHAAAGTSSGCISVQSVTPRSGAT